MSCKDGISVVNDYPNNVPTSNIKLRTPRCAPSVCIGYYCVRDRELQNEVLKSSFVYNIKWRKAKVTGRNGNI